MGGADGSESDEKKGGHADAVIEKCADLLLDAGDACGRKRGRFVGRSGILHLCAIGGCGPSMGSTLMFSQGGMLEAMQEGRDIVWHGYVDIFGGIIPGDSEPTI